MKKINVLMLFISAEILLLNNSFALTPDECNQSGGACVCIAFPGSDPICTRSKQTSLALGGKKENKNYFYIGLE